MSSYHYFKGLIPQPEQIRDERESLSLDFAPRYGNRLANRRARGELHPLPPSRAALSAALKACCAR